MGSQERLAYRRLQAEGFLLLPRIQRAIEARVADSFEESGIVGITPAQASALLLLFQAREPMRARELADQMAISEVTVARFVAALESGGWVRRKPDPSDGRAMLLQPTKKSRDLFPKFVAVFNETIDRALSGIDEPEVRHLVRSLTAIHGNLMEDSQAV